MELVSRVWQHASKNPNGFTIDPLTGQPATLKDGRYIVSLLETQNSHGFGGCANATAVAVRRKTWIGGWLDEETNRYYFDASIIFDDLEEAKAKARAEKQIAFFDLLELRAIFL